MPLKDGYPDDPRLEVARRLLASGQFTEARIVADTVAKQRPDMGRAHFYLGLALVKLKQYQQARPELERAIQLDQPYPERKHAHHFLGWASYHLGELDRAKSDFEAHLADVPDEPDSTFGLGLIAFDEDRLDDAERYLRKAIDLQQDPKASKRDLSKAWARLGDVAMRRDQPAEAEDRYMKALALYPDFSEVWAKLARSRDRLGKTKEADSARQEEVKALERVKAREEAAARRAAKAGQPGSPQEPSPPAPPAASPGTPPSAPPVGPGVTPPAPPTEPQPR